MDRLTDQPTLDVRSLPHTAQEDERRAKKGESRDDDVDGEAALTRHGMAWRGVAWRGVVVALFVTTTITY